ncbi:MAG: AraC family transcriptional regulator, partial [Pedobacter sp.]
IFGFRLYKLKKKRQGFEGERILELSENQKKVIDHKDLICFSKIGFFPKAKYQHEESDLGNDYHILVYCIKGYGKLELNNISYDIKTGEFFFVPKHTPYKYYADSKNPWNIYWFNFTGNSADGLLSLYYESTGSYRGYLKYNEERIQLFDVIFKNLKKGYSKSILMLLNMSLLHFLSSLVLNIRSKPHFKDKNQDIVNAAIEFMNLNLHQSLPLTSIVQQVNVSVSHFSALFKTKTGISPLDYYNQLKMQKACEYLEFTDMLVKEIAFKLGIEDAQYFSRLFSRKIGMSPNSYRKAVYRS